MKIRTVKIDRRNPIPRSRIRVDDPTPGQLRPPKYRVETQVVGRIVEFF